MSIWDRECRDCGCRESSHYTDGACICEDCSGYRPVATRIAKAQARGAIGLFAVVQLVLLWAVFMIASMILIVVWLIVSVVVGVKLGKYASGKLEASRG